MVRLNKYLAECGICSRREADKLIDKGHVTVNGRTAQNGMQITETDIVLVHGKQVVSPNAKVILAYNKPVGITCTEKDKHAKKTIVEAVKYPVRLTYAGRLDKDSEGLIIMTNDGDLIQKMMKAANYHEKEYIVKVNKEIENDFTEKMSKGVFLKELEQITRPCKCEKLGKYTFKIVLTQGLNRQIRRMCEALGYKVTALKRVRVMNVELGTLKPGEYRELQGNELIDLYRLCGLDKKYGR